MKNVYETGALTGVIIVTVGIVIFIYQFAVWLKSGVWHAYPLSTVINLSSYWLRNPQDWQGLHKMISWILTVVPASVVLMSVGSFIAFVFSHFSKGYE